MRLGADPDQLEAAGRRCAVLAHALRAARQPLDRLGHVRWSGPAAHRARDQARRATVQLSLGAVRMEHLAGHLRTQAAQQRAASLADPRRRVERASDVGDGRRVVRVGAEQAGTLVVLVPGVGTDTGDRDRLDADALAVWTALAVAAERDGHRTEGLAVVSWLGYDPPDLVVGGLARGPARVGAAQLVHDVEQWRRHGAHRVLVVGHSYGGVVSTRAAAAGLAADEVVLLGAPGLGVAGPEQLRLVPGAELWSAAALDDPISLLARAGVVWGPDPADHAHRLPTGASGHSGYLRDPELLAALAELALHDRRPAGTVAAPHPRGAPWASP